MNIFLTGSSGLLGNALANSFVERGWKVLASAHQKTPSQPRMNIHKIDLSRTDSIRQFLERNTPDAIVNAAALSRPADCAANPKLSEALNVGLPSELVSYAKRENKRCIHFSTDMVFDGKTGNYNEDSPTHPTNLYGEHKLESEIRIQDIYPASCIIRLPLLMGNSPAGTRSAHEAQWKLWSQDQVTPLFEDEWRTPVSVTNVAQLTSELLQKQHIQGLFHWCGATRISRWEMGSKISQKFFVSENLLQRTQARSNPKFKDRPLDLTLDCSKLKAQVQTEPAPFESQLRELVIPEG